MGVFGWWGMVMTKGYSMTSPSLMMHNRIEISQNRIRFERILDDCSSVYIIITDASLAPPGAQHIRFQKNFLLSTDSACLAWPWKTKIHPGCILGPWSEQQQTWAWPKPGLVRQKCIVDWLEPGPGTCTTPRTLEGFLLNSNNKIRARMKCLL